MQAKLRVEDLESNVGRKLGPGAWRAVDQETIDAFAHATDDEQWIHVDPERAAAGPFGTTIAHGYLTLSLCASMLAELFTVEDAGMVVNYGLDRVRFPAPVPSGSRVRAHGEVISADRHDWGAQLVVRVTVEVDGGDRPACVADTVSRFYAGDGGGG